MSDTNNVTVAIEPEVTWGTTVGTELEYLRINGEDLGHATGSTESGEITQTRDVAAIVRTEVNADGGVNGEISYGALDTLLEGVMMGAWQAGITTSATLTAVAAGNKVTGANWAALGYVAGMWVRFSEWVDANNNGYAKVVSADATDLVVTGLTLTNATEAAKIQTSGYIRNGTTFKSFSIEKQFTDLATTYHVFRGMVVNNFGVNIQVGNISTWSASFLGKKAETAAATIAAGYAAVNTNDPMNAIDNVTAIWEGGSLTTLDVTALSLSVNNNARARRAIGSAEAIGISIGRFILEGTFNAYFENNTLYAKFLGWTNTSMSFRLIDAAAQAYVYTMPACKITQAKVVAGGPDGDVMVECSFKAYRDPTTLATLQVDKFAAPA